jgi:hypothetical protein
MSDTPETGPSADADAESLGELATLVIGDGVVGAIAGAGGNAVILTTLFVAARLGGFDPAAFATVAELVGLGAVLSADQLLYVGVAMFVVGGLTVLPLLLATLGAYLPGQRYATRGLAFGAIVWTGFVLAYYPGYTGGALAVYAAMTFAGHLGYGYVTGWLMDRLFAAEGRPVVAASLGAPVDATHDAGEREIPRSETTLVDEDERGN